MGYTRVCAIEARDWPDKQTKIVKGLREQSVWETLSATAEESGLNMKDLNNLDETIPQLFKTWQDAPDSMHRYITFLEKLREK